MKGHLSSIKCRHGYQSVPPEHAEIGVPRQGSPKESNDNAGYANVDYANCGYCFSSHEVPRNVQQKTDNYYK